MVSASREGLPFRKNESRTNELKQYWKMKKMTKVRSALTSSNQTGRRGDATASIEKPSRLPLLLIGRQLRQGSASLPVVKVRRDKRDEHLKEETDGPRMRNGTNQRMKTREHRPTVVE